MRRYLARSSRLLRPGVALLLPQLLKGRDGRRGGRGLGRCAILVRRVEGGEGEAEEQGADAVHCF